MKRSTRWANVWLLLGTLVLLLPLAELVVRFARPQTLPSQSFIRGFVLKGMYVRDEKTGFRLAPKFRGRIERSGIVTEFATNSLGLRDDEIEAKNEGRTRILALGDSFTWGWGVGQGEEWISVVDRVLDEKAGRDGVECINAGVNGYGTENELELLRSIGPQLSPDLVLVGFFPNDYTDNVLGATGVYTVKDGYLHDHFSQKMFRENFLARESHLYRLITRAAGEARRRWMNAPLTTQPLKQFTEKEFEEGMRLSEMHLLEMHRECEAMGARLAVVWLPADVYAFSRQPPDVPLQRELQRRIESAGIPSLDLLPIVRAEINISGLYYPGDGHFTARGNRVAGRAIARWIEEAGLLSDRGPDRSVARSTSGRGELPEG
jgi:lysophospholipase L1-like esterase